MIILYIDGSETFQNSSRSNIIVSWGIVAHFNDSTTEMFGSVLKTNAASDYRGKHEKIAFIESYLYAKSHGFKPEEMVFYSDDEFVCYMNQWAQNINYYECFNRGKKALKQAVQRYYPNMPELYREVLSCLMTARFHKVKGHKTCIYNHRVDYLCRVARSEHFKKKTEYKSFEDWFKTNLIDAYKSFQNRSLFGLSFFDEEVV